MEELRFTMHIMPLKFNIKINLNNLAILAHLCIRFSEFMLFTFHIYEWFSVKSIEIDLYSEI